LNVLNIRRKIAEEMHNDGIWLKHPDKGYIRTLINVLDKWNKVTSCQIKTLSKNLLELTQWAKSPKKRSVGVCF